MLPPLDSWHSSTLKLCEQAEAILQQLPPDPPLQSVWRWQQRLRELQLYQAEVEMQHEELRESQLALQAALDKYTELYDFAPIGYLTLDDSGTILEANLTGSALLGLERRDLIGRLLYHSLSTREDKDTFYLHCKRAVATGGLESCEVTIRQPDGTKRVARLDSRAFNTEQPQLHTALRDVTARRQIEADLRTAQAEEVDLRAVRDELEQRVQERTEALERINARLEQEIAERKQLEAQMVQAQKMQAIGTLAGGIAHEFNNVLAVILGYTTLLQKQVQLDRTALEYVQEVKRAGERAKEFVQQILMFSRQDPVTHRLAPLSRVVNETLRFLRRSLPATIELHVHMAPQVESVRVMQTPLFQVLINLCSNAEYGMRESGGRLDIEAVVADVDAAFATRHPPLRPGSHLRLTVRDTGVGMVPDVMSRIFEPFFTTKEVGQGTGMGLAIVHGIVTHHGGAVTVESAPGVGTTFAIYLPQLDAPVATELPADVSPTPASCGRLLVVDDEERIVRAMRDLLETHGYEVVTATSGVEALHRFRLDPHGFDCVITDQTMPRMTGADLTLAMRQLHADIPVILCTGFSHVIDAVQAQALGLAALMMKPIDLAELVAVIQQLVERHHQPEG